MKMVGVCYGAAVNYAAVRMNESCLPCGADGQPVSEKEGALVRPIITLLRSVLDVGGVIQVMLAEPVEFYNWRIKVVVLNLLW